jgi:hypothetical protein
LTHTDLKPENILLKNDKSITIVDLEHQPINVQRKKEMYDGNIPDSDESDSKDEGKKE